MFDPVLQVLLVGAHHLETIKHCACRDSDNVVGGIASTCIKLCIRSSRVALPLSSKAFLWASQSSSLVTVILDRGNFPWREKTSHETGICPKLNTRKGSGPGNVLITDLEYEATHPGAGRQHEEDVWEEHEVTLTLLLMKSRQ